ncbi:MAG TPA: MarC family protein [Bacteroidales bacterium]|jgi:multiple antibiotic resistance protein|nr:MarC family protein [Bacteroidales bacterium]
MVLSIVEFIVMLNPFALFLYLEPIRKDLKHREFMTVIFKATLISLTVCLLFFYSGEFIFKSIFQIEFDSFRIFGGIIIFSYAYFFIIKGQKALIMIKENLDDLASEIALPFMVGAGTISLSILLSQKQTPMVGTGILAIVFLINFLSIFFLKKLRDSFDRRKFKTAFDKNMEVLLRLNGFFIGAIGINMVLTGIKNMFGLG